MRSAAHLAFTVLALTTAPGALATAGPPLVALRVDLEPIEARGKATALAVVVQVAPEDRPRVGPSAWFELELRRGRESVDRLSRAVEVDGHGMARVDVVWPPGAYDLELEIRSARGDARGRWSDRVTVQALPPTPAPAAAPSAPAEPAPTPAPEPTPSPHAENVATTPTPPPPAEAQAGAPLELVETPAVETAAVLKPSAAPAPTPEPGVAATVARPPAAVSTAAPKPRSSATAGDIATLTALVTRMQRPVPSLGRETLRLKGAGRSTPILDVAGPESEPLSLALAVDLSATVAPRLPELRRHLGQLALQVEASGGSVSLVVGVDVASRVLDWGAGPDAVVEALRSSGSERRGDLAGMVTEAFAGLAGRPGRRLALVVTDGGDTGNRDGWRRAEEAAVAAAAPVLVVELPGPEGRPSAALDRLVDACGGERFAAPTDDVLGTVLRHYGNLLEASWLVRFERPPGAGPGPIRVKITTADDSLDVRYPQRVR